eukprot:g33439.t1
MSRSVLSPQASQYKIENAIKPTYSSGAEGHGTRECHPCAFYWKEKGCSSGAECNFCHLCDPGEKKRRQKEKRMVWRSIDRMRQAFTGAMEPRVD